VGRLGFLGMECGPGGVAERHRKDKIYPHAQGITVIPLWLARRLGSNISALVGERFCEVGQAHSLDAKDIAWMQGFVELLGRLRCQHWGQTMTGFV
jgi:hypothetical protein